MSNTCGPTFYNHFCPMWRFLRLQVQWSHDNTHFFVKEIRNGSVSPTRPSATPTACTWIGHAYVDRTLFFRCTRWLSTVHRGARPVFTRPSLSEREHDLSSKALSFSKERMRKRDRERVCVRASMTGESSRACFSWRRFIAERNLLSQSSTELEQKS